jgi:hypothetical protein
MVGRSHAAGPLPLHVVRGDAVVAQGHRASHPCPGPSATTGRSAAAAHATRLHRLHARLGMVLVHAPPRPRRPHPPGESDPSADCLSLPPSPLSAMADGGRCKVLDG